jgi:hypothetical protein
MMSLGSTKVQVQERHENPKKYVEKDMKILRNILKENGPLCIQRVQLFHCSQCDKHAITLLYMMRVGVWRVPLCGVRSGAVQWGRYSTEILPPTRHHPNIPPALIYIRTIQSARQLQ